MRPISPEIRRIHALNICLRTGWFSGRRSRQARYGKTKLAKGMNHPQTPRAGLRRWEKPSDRAIFAALNWKRSKKTMPRMRAGSTTKRESVEIQLAEVLLGGVGADCWWSAAENARPAQCINAAESFIDSDDNRAPRTALRLNKTTPAGTRAFAASCSGSSEGVGTAACFRW